MIKNFRIDKIFHFNSPEHLLISAGYFYYRKKGGGYSYVRKDEPKGRYEAHIKHGGIEVHYDLWIDKHKHMTLPSLYTLQMEKKRLLQIMYGEIPPNVIVDRQLPPKVWRKVRKKNEMSLAQEELARVDWDKLKELNNVNKDEKSYPQSTTCIYIKNMIRYIQTKVKPWL